MLVEHIKDISIHILKQEDIPYLKDLFSFTLTREQSQILYQQLMSHITYGIYDNELIGIIQLYERKEGIYEVGYRLKEQFRHHGYMRQALRLLLKKYQTKNIKKIYARVEETNIASKKVLENTGFLQEINKNGVLIYVYASSVENSTLRSYHSMENR